MATPSISASALESAANPGASPRTWTINTGTPGASAKLFVAICPTDDSDAVTGVTYNGASMTAVADVLGGTVNWFSLWTLDAPASGSNTLSVAYSGDGTYSGSCWWCVVDDAGALGTPYSASGTSNAPALGSQTCPAGGMLLAFARHAFSGSNPTISAGTPIILTRLGNVPHMLAYRTSTGAFTWGTASSQQWGAIGVPIAAAGGGASIDPSAGHAIAAGYAPSIGQPQTLAPAKGAATFTGHTPGVVQGASVAPAVGHIAATGYTPAIGQPVAVAPSIGHAVVVGYAPVVSQPTGIAPSAGHAVAAGYAPIIGQPRSVAPAAGHATATGYAPGIEQPTGIAPSNGAIVVAGHVPSIGQPRTIEPSVGHAVVGGYAPVISQIAAVAPTKGAIIVAGYTPTIAQPRTVAPSVGHARYAGRVPGISQTGQQMREVMTLYTPITRGVDLQTPIARTVALHTPIGLERS